MLTSKPIRVLYMEDDVGLARLLQKRLERLGYVVDLSHDGASGLAMYNAGLYDVVAVDQKMPVHDGLEVIRMLAERGPLPPTIMITGTGNEKLAIEALKLGAVDYIVKDVEGGYLELLPSVIEQALYQQRLVKEKQQAVAELQQLNRSLALLGLVSQELTASLDLSKILEMLLQAATEAIGAEGSSVWFYEAGPPPGLVCRAAYPDVRSRSPVNKRLRPDQGIAGWVMQEGESVVVAFTRDDPRFSPEIDKEIGFQTNSMLAAPLRVRGLVIGVLEVINKRKGNFNVNDRVMVEALAASAAIAIDNARLVETLRQQTLELHARNEELDAFAHTVAHDLKTPLGPIIGMSQFLEHFYRTMSEGEIKESVQSIARSGRKMNNIINELLLLAQMHEADIDLKPLDMAAVVAEAEQRLSYMIEEYQAKLLLPSTWPAAVGYGPWLEEVWANYLSNAMKYGGRPPCIELGARLEANGLVRFWIHDNGVGLTTEEQVQLFAPFTQLSKTRAQGHGLGLSIVRRIVERLGGQVGVESEGVAGRGSTFFFTLPAASRLVEQPEGERVFAV